MLRLHNYTNTNEINLKNNEWKLIKSNNIKEVQVYPFMAAQKLNQNTLDTTL